MQHLVALGAVGNYLLDPVVLELLVVEPAKLFEIFHIAGPQKIMPAAALVAKNHWFDVKEVQQTNAVPGQAYGVHRDV